MTDTASPGAHFENSRELLHPCLHSHTPCCSRSLSPICRVLENTIYLYLHVWREIPCYKQTLLPLGGLWATDWPSKKRQDLNWEWDPLASGPGSIWLYMTPGKSLLKSLLHTEKDMASIPKDPWSQIFFLWNAYSSSWLIRPYMNVQQFLRSRPL